jgi:hypothetical protein
MNGIRHFQSFSEVFALYNLNEVDIYGDEPLTKCSVHSTTQSLLHMLKCGVSRAQLRGRAIRLEYALVNIQRFTDYAVLLRWP